MSEDRRGDKSVRLRQERKGDTNVSLSEKSRYDKSARLRGERSISGNGWLIEVVVSAMVVNGP